MSLIRICDHFRNNPKRIDKLIAIKGLPQEWFFREGPEGLELKKPWVPDVEANIPHDIRHLCDPVYVTFRYSPVDRNQKEVMDRRQVLGFRIDYNSEPGREMWDQIERYIEESVPRGERVPVPVLCARDERSAFETFEARRTPVGSLELRPAPVPMIDLNRYLQPVQPPVVGSVPPPPPVAIVEPEIPAQSTPAQAALYFCEGCDAKFEKAQALRMHIVVKHRRAEKVGAS